MKYTDHIEDPVSERETFVLFALLNDAMLDPRNAIYIRTVLERKDLR